MKKLSLLTLVLSASMVAFAADEAKQQVKNAAKKIGDAPNYSWTATPKSENADLPMGTTEGKAEKGGFTYFSLTFNNNQVEGAFKGDKSAINMDGTWQASDDLSGDLEWVKQRMKSYKAPAAEAADLADKSADLKQNGDVYEGTLNEAAIKELIGFRDVDVTNGKGKIKYWVKDGALTKYEWTANATLSYQGESRDVNRTTTVEIKDIGKTKVEIPQDAKSKLS